jgi:hypothetical protein
MTRLAETITLELPPTVRTRVRLPEPKAPSRLFPGWGPGLTGH